MGIEALMALTLIILTWRALNEVYRDLQSTQQMALVQKHVVLLGYDVEHFGGPGTSIDLYPELPKVPN